MARLQHISNVSAHGARWTIDGVISGLTLLWGGPGIGKSFTAISMAASVASGRPWIGRRTKQGPVYYIVGEGGAESVAHRVRAALSEWTVDVSNESVPFYLISPGMDLKENGIEFAETVGQPYSLEVMPSLIIVDTLARNFGGNENQQEDMSAFVHTLDVLRHNYRSDIVVIHHANRQDDLRGSSVLFGAVDVCWHMTRPPHSKDEMMITADKLRERDASGATVRYRMDKKVILDEANEPIFDEFGDKETTLIVKPTKGDLERAKALQHHGLEVIGEKSSIKYAEWKEHEKFKDWSKAQFDGALTFIVTFPGRWHIMRGHRVGTYVKASAGVENEWR